MFLVFMPGGRHGELGQFRGAASSFFAETHNTQAKPQNSDKTAAFLAFLPVLLRKAKTTLNSDLGGGVQSRET